MRRELDNYLCKKFPLLFADRHKSPQETAMCWGFECGDGWYEIIKEAAEKLEPLIAKEKENIDAIVKKQRKFYWYPLKTLADNCGKLDLGLRKRIAGFLRISFCNECILTLTEPLRVFYFFLYKKAGLYETMHLCYPKASQIKEKYGRLRFYVAGETDEMAKIIREAERKSAKTCEECGKPGESRDNGWSYTACREHTKKEDL